MRRFLRFGVELALEGRSDELKEYVLGTEIFDRPPTFDPRIDPIVRVEARRLRSKLKAYYDGEGGDDAVRIEFPTGTYVPTFTSGGADAVSVSKRAADPVIAVLPLANLGGNADAVYFSDGLTEELTHALTKVEGLRVVAWASASLLRDQAHDLPAIARQLRASHVLMGSVRQDAGDRVRVTVRLIEVATGQVLMSEAFDRRRQDLLALQAEISAAIVQSLRSALLGECTLPEPAVAHSTPTPRDARVYDLYLRGRFYWNKRTGEGFRRAAQLFEEAIALDAGFAQAWSGLADALTLQADMGFEPSSAVMPRAKASAERALELDPSLAESHTSLGLIAAMYEWRWDEASCHFERALELNPSYVTAHHWYGCDYLALLGRFDEAVEEMDLALRLDPLSHVINESMAYTLMLGRRYHEALAKQRANLEMHPHFYRTYTAMGRVHVGLGEYDQAIALFLKGSTLAGEVMPTTLGALAQACGMAGRTADARQYLARLNHIGRERFIPSTAVAMAHIGLGEMEEAVTALEGGAQRRELSVAAIGVHPGYDPLRGHPRFEALLREMGLRPN